MSGVIAGDGAARCCIVPPYLLRQLIAARPEHRAALELALAHDDTLRLRRSTISLAPTRAAVAATGAPDWLIYTTANTSDLPGTLARSPGDPGSDDVAVNEAADGIAGTLAMYAEVYGRDSYDDQGATVIGTVHYEKDYDNAFWNGDELVFGDGDGVTFGRFTQSVDVLGHELTHAVTERTAALAYEGQPGALNESVSDVFGSCAKQRLLGQTADQADWLIGAGLFLASVQGRALRDMAHPGTAYDDPTLGKDPQPADLDHYDHTTDDNGGVHINSGIPNRAFYLAATAIGGSSAEGAGRIWYAALTGGQVTAQTDFAGFAAATVAAAGEQADAVRTAWQTVGVTPSASTAAPGLDAPPASTSSTASTSDSDAMTGRLVRVVRSGGFAGVSRQGEVELVAPSQAAGREADGTHHELADLVDRIDLQGVRSEPPRPDRFVYHFDLAGQTAVVPEHALTADLRRVADLVLGD